jgi:hypothetical protein
VTFVVATETLWLVYIVSLLFAVLAVVGFLIRIVIRRVVRWYRDAVAKTNDYWAAYDGSGPRR